MLYVKRWKKSLIVVLSVLLVAGALGELTRRVVLAQTVLGTKLHVLDMGVVYKNVGGPSRVAIAVVDVEDENHIRIDGALVEGNWSGCFSYADSATTQTYTYTDSYTGVVSSVMGRALIEANKSNSCWGQKVRCFWTFKVTKISKSGYTYDANANLKTTASMQCQ